MQLGMVGLGRMGANMVRRLLKGGHECVVFDMSPQAVSELTAENAVGSASLADLVTSGGVWGLERGYCMMIGGEKPVVGHLDPIFGTLAPGSGDIPPTPGREKISAGTAERGYLHCGPNGAGHFVKMVHNGIEYGLMAAYAEGMGILRSA